jgi:hypothetical protein
MEAGSLLATLVIVVDALDECEKESNIRHILKVSGHAVVGYS